MAKERPHGSEGILERKKKKVDRPRQYRVVFHNDDYTTMELVVLILMEVFRRSRTEATHVMLTVHHKGKGVAGVYNRELAETKVVDATEMARDHGAPLRVTMEPT